MKRFVFLFLSIMSVMVSAKAQTFTQHLQQSQAGKGKVSVSQSREIDALVNGNVTRSATLTEALKRTFANRGHSFTATQFAQVIEFADDAAMQKKWKAFCRKIDTK